MLLPVRENLPKTRKELHPGSLRQGSGDVTQLDESIQQRPGLTKVSVKMAGYKIFFFLHRKRNNRFPILLGGCISVAPCGDSGRSVTLTSRRESRNLSWRFVSMCSWLPASRSAWSFVLGRAVWSPGANSMSISTSYRRGKGNAIHFTH